MLTCCANPDCRSRRYTDADGEEFHFEIVSISIAASDDLATTESSDEVPVRETACFWLCVACSESVTLALDPLQGLHLIQLEALPADDPQRLEFTAQDSLSC
jgi:hypothetical protein